MSVNKNIVPKSNISTTSVFAIQASAPLHASWSKPDGDGRKNLEKYLGGTINGRIFKATKSGVINQCSQYFLEQGVIRTNSQIKTCVIFDLGCSSNAITQPKLVKPIGNCKQR
ncbi:hypothetical protein PHYBLDRAFT_175846 [Phycomyces blakesleeanus NRRL 1555(-)]|uniref:Uncharacterized protein n=1 Tax=Phycomyces blakesleeanus (strain ATCC 8743b / DSM 1359 / FGSC 10004 / NBRC 33097 / NRRL 1555) TaxID=763407 RepID=A0A162W9N7_PHYB8|nr:hypothetical protein PHYBLDRAFT_175846 [Phycomyces blakesleeanus NRRL 1555(-)]OAD65665.1 hypothetical protein PHYBLDRAFT_175846 [Phycomyces blakesleeanus NRRL 1555(-)]|eukprot:XP_018283705.1 hypothetical protein PHYBLDRAFT_175846 [Phycomyces blakesleeanus NRRL 1555(-)]